MRCPKCGKFMEYSCMEFMSKSGKRIIRVWHCKPCDRYWKDSKMVTSIAKFKRLKKEGGDRKVD